MIDQIDLAWIFHCFYESLCNFVLFSEIFKQDTLSPWRDLRPKLPSCFDEIFLILWRKNILQRFLTFYLINFHEAIKFQSFEFCLSDVIHVSTKQHLSHLVFPTTFVNFMEKEPTTKFYCVFDYFSWTYDVKKFGIIDLCFGVSEVNHDNQHT